ncbi:GspH/FimT family protein [Thermus thermamylovorans]|uniref:Prepilin-type N-terminal cleavage/methylation domain-containing protein n=1 Tax=Thermus thermamylovorans TaxID=2509362 RepID=A0A4Q9B031_9DEIN|nr:GspH/FimT family protein [Thermus thermamylovorans]TBH17402.1 prepilin-type N-terminal cleavage/methylation domain-containing protein [Thermus thermamylovorans]
MRKPRGLTLIELVIILAILGILLALGTGYLRSDRIAVNQAAQSLAAQVTRARLEAIRQNTTAGLRFEAGNAQSAGGYVVYVVVPPETGEGTTIQERVVQRVAFGQGEWARVRLAQVSGETAFAFDSRGIPLSFHTVTVTLSNRANTYTRQVAISPQGRAEVR